MPLPFYISGEEDGARLFELSDGRFQLLADGPMSPFMDGYQYLLVENKLAEFLQTIEIERLRYEAAIIFNRLNGAEHTTHTLLRVGQYFSSDQIHDLNVEGLRFMVMGNQHYFVSPELKVLLEAEYFPYLRFSEGLTSFVGMSQG